MKWSIDEAKLPTREEVKTLVRSCRERAEAAIASNRRQPVIDWAVLHLIIGSGLRSHEAALLLVGDIKVGHGQSAIHVREGKGGKPRVVAISRKLKAHLQRFLRWKKERGESVEQDASLFISERGERFTTRGLRYLFRRSLRNAGIGGKYGIHALRHFHLSSLYEATKDIRLTQEQAGHASVSTTQVYTHVSLGRRQDAVDRLF